MAGKGATLALKITGDSRDGVRALDDVEGKAGRLDGVFGKMGLGIAAGVGVGVAAIGGLAVSAFNSASELQQSSGAIESVFGKMAGAIETSARGAASSVGLSTSAYENLAAVLGAQLTGAGMSIEDATTKTQGLVEKGADLAATFGGSTADAVGALSSALKGEMDPLERYGVSLKQSDINARLAADGNAQLTGEALKTATANAALSLITDQTASSQGAFARESDTAAGAQQRLGAKFEDIKAVLGEKLLPIFTDVANFVLEKVIPYFEDLTKKGGPLSDSLEKIGTFIKDKVLPVAKDMAEYFKDHVMPVFDDVKRVLVDVVVPALKTLWSYVSDYVIPIFKTTLTPVLDGVRDVFKKVTDKLVENKDKFQEIYDKVKPFLDFMRDNVAPFIGGALKLAFEGLSAALGPVIDSITWILDKAASVVGFLGDVGGFLFGGDGGGATGGGGGSARRTAALVGATAAPLRGASMPAGAAGGRTGAGSVTPVLAGGDTYQITISGVLNADDAAEQIARLLERRDRMTGRISAGAFT
jgi:hypothetical protein